MTADADLVARSRARDAVAFGALVDRHHRLVFGVALATCGDRVLAEDVVQDAFVTAWRNLDRLRDAGRVGSWVAGIARNLAGVAVRERSRGRGEDIDVDRVRTPEDDIVDREDRELLQRALARLPEAHREALVLYYLEGQSIARIADGLNVRDDVVKKRLSRGRKALRDSLARVEAALTRVRPNAAMPGTVVAAITVLGGREALAAPGLIGKIGKVTAMSVKTKLGIAVVAALVLATGATWLGMTARGEASKRAASKPTASADDRDRASEARNHGSGGFVRRMHDQARRASLLEQIRKATELRRSAGSTSRATTSAGSSPAAGEEIDPAYVKDALVEIVPLLEECFKQGLERNPKLRACSQRERSPDDPDFDLNCQVTMSMTIEGEPGVGGLVTNTSIDGADKVGEPDAVECIQETIYSLEIGPPPKGGAVEARFEIKIGLDPPTPG